MLKRLADKRNMLKKEIMYYLAKFLLFLRFKFMFSERATKNDKIFFVCLNLVSNHQMDGEDFIFFVDFLENMIFKLIYINKTFIVKSSQYNCICKKNHLTVEQSLVFADV